MSLVPQYVLKMMRKIVFNIKWLANPIKSYVSGIYIIYQYVMKVFVAFLVFR